MPLFTTTRLIPARAPEIFAALATPARLARWWGPAGFTNTFTHCDFAPGGRWLLTMHGPDGRDYPNEYRFAHIDAPHTVEIQHVLAPQFRLTIRLTPAADGAGTVVSWAQAFADAGLAARMASIVVPANEQNLDRLTAEVVGKVGDS